MDASDDIDFPFPSTTEQPPLGLINECLVLSHFASQWDGLDVDLSSETKKFVLIINLIKLLFFLTVKQKSAIFEPKDSYPATAAHYLPYSKYTGETVRRKTFTKQPGQSA